MAKLTLTAAQTAVLQQIYSDLEDAFFYGVDVDGIDPNLDLDPSPSYDDDKMMGSNPKVSATQMRTITKQTIARGLATVVKRVASGGINATVTLAKITGGGVNGSLTFTNGVLTSKVDPT